MRLRKHHVVWIIEVAVEFHDLTDRGNEMIPYHIGFDRLPFGSGDRAAQDLFQ